MLPLPRSAACLLALLLGLCAPGSALAVTQVYHSPNDDGVAGSTDIPSGGTQSVYLYIDGGAAASAAGTACHVGTGDEVCGYDLELTALTGLTLSSFTPDGLADLLVNFSAASMKLNGLDTQSPVPGPHRIGELVVNAVVGGALELTSGEVVGADLTSEALAPGTLVTVPEPGHVLLLASGVGLLIGLGRWRVRR